MSPPTNLHRATSAPKVACPTCGAGTFVRIQYGYPAFTEQLEQDLKAGRVVLGGCVIVDGQPDVACTACGTRFRTDGRPVGDASW